MAPGNASGFGYFLFDTNAEAVVKRIQTAMQGLGKTMDATTAKAGGLRMDRSSLNSFANDLGKVNTQVQGLVAGAGTGARATKALQSELEKIASTGLKPLQQNQLREFLQAPAGFLNALNLGDVGKAQGKAYANNLTAELQALKKTNPAEMAGIDIRRISNLAKAGNIGKGDRLELPAGSSIMDQARLAAFKENIAASYGRGNMSVADIRAIHPSLESDIISKRYGDPDLLKTVTSKGKYRPAGDNLRGLQEEERKDASAALARVREINQAHEQALGLMKAQHAEALTMNKVFDDHAKMVKEAWKENETRDRQRLSTDQYAAKYENQNRDATAKAQAAQLQADHESALAENRRREGDRVATQGTRFGSYGRVNGDLYSVDRLGGATRIEVGEHEKIAKALTAETKAREKNNAEITKEENLERRRSGGLGENFSSGLLGRGINGGVGGKPSIGEGIRNELATLGTVARYTGVYAVLGAVTGALADTKSEVLDFTDSLTDLKVALNVGDNVDSGLVDQLQQIAVVSGSNTGAALDAAARGIRAFGDNARSSGADISTAGTDIAEASTQIALITGKDLRDATGDVVAIASAFGLAASQANQVVDAVSAAKDFGGDPTNISQGLANFATTAGAAGFTLGEAANALSLVIARTDQSGQAAATRLSRITSILAGTTGRKVIQDLNAAGLRDNSGKEIDAEASVKDQLRQIAQAYQNAAPELQGQIRSALGGTSNLRELLPLLEPGAFEKIIAKGSDQAGRGADEFRRRTTDLVGIFKKLQGDLSAIQVNLFRSGAFDGIALAFKALEPALNVLGRLLGLFDRMNGYAKIFLGTLLDIQIALLALKTVGFIPSAKAWNVLTPQKVGNGAATFGYGNAAVAEKQANKIKEDASASSAAREAAKREANSLALAQSTVAIETNNVARAEASYAEGELSLAALNAAKALLTNAEAASVNTAKRAQDAFAPAGPRSLNSGLLTSIGYMAAAAAAIYAASEIFAAVDKNAAIKAVDRKNSESIANTDLTSSGSVTGLAQSLAANAAELRKSQMGHSLSSYLVKDQRDKEIADTHSQQGEYEALARRLAAEEKYSAGLQQTTLFGNTAAATTQNVADAFAKLSSAGVDAVGQWDLLIAAVLHTPGASGRAPLPTDDPEKFAAGVATNLQDGLSQALYKRDGQGHRIARRDANGKVIKDARGDTEYQTYDLYGPEYTAGAPGLYGGSSETRRDKLTPNQVAALLAKNEAKAQKAAADKLKSFHLADGVAPNEAQLALMRDAAIKAYGIDKLGKNAAAVAAYLRKSVTAQYLAELKAAAASPGTTPQDPGQTEQYIEKSLMPAYTSGLAGMPKSDYKGRRKAGANLISGLKAQQLGAILGSDGSEKDKAALASIARQIAVAQEMVSNDAISDNEDLRKAAQERAKGHKAVARIGRAFFAKEVKIAQAAGNTDALIAIFNLASQVEVALAQKAAHAAVDAANAYVATLSADHGSISAIDHAEAAVKGAAAIAGVTDEAAGRSTAPKKTKDNKFINPDLSSGKGSGKTQLTAAQIAAARRDASVNPRDGLAQAAADVQTAKANLAAADKGDDPGAFYAAKKALRQAQAKYADLVMSASQSARNVRVARAGGDLARSKAAVDDAREDLSKYARGTQEYNDALSKLITAQREASDVAAKYKFDKKRAGSDLTDALAQARIDTKEAADKLARDKKAGRGRDVITADQIDLKNKHNTEEQVAFDRNLKAMQDKEALGQISHQAYIRYLQSEHDRLVAIKHKTQQQNDELVAIDMALKSATQAMGGQFNLGDIKVPTPYEARRYVKTQAVGVNYLGETANNNTTTSSSVTNNFTINGTDTVTVRKVLTDLLGPLATQRSTTASRKG